MAFVYGTVITSVIALIIAVPISVGVALLLTEVVPRRWSQPIVYVIDLLAVVPSVVWGLWGILVLVPWLQTHLPRRSPPASTASRCSTRCSAGRTSSGASFFTAGIILAIMITPIITSLSREVIATVPDDRQGGRVRARRHPLGDDPRRRLAAQPGRRGRRGARRPWPGDGRDDRGGARHRRLAGDHRRTCSTPVTRSPRSSRNQFGEASGGEFRSALIGLGLFLFVLTIIVNLVARGIVERSARKMRGA